METLYFVLSMPSNNSWNGRWSGEEKVFAVKRSFRAKDLQTSDAIARRGYYSYNFGDGWRAAIEIKRLSTADGARLIRKSSGFCGYDWMVDSIIRDGDIYGPTQPKRVEAKATL